MRKLVFMATPFALAGVGLYGDNSWAMYTPGINAGGGMDVLVGGFQFFAESRIHQYLRDARESVGRGHGITQIPISFGLKF